MWPDSGTGEPASSTGCRLCQRAYVGSTWAQRKGFVKAQLAPFKYPRWIEFVGELPKTATGKIQRFELRTSRLA